MLLKGMLRLCHLLVIRLSCNAHHSEKVHPPLRSDRRIECAFGWIVWDPDSCRWTCSCDADIAVRGFGVCGAVGPLLRLFQFVP